MKHLLACAIAIACGVAAGIDTIDVFVPGEKGYVVSHHDPPTHNSALALLPLAPKPSVVPRCRRLHEGAPWYFHWSAG